MNPNDYYKRLIASITEDDVRRVAEIMARHIGEENRVSIQSLVAQTKLNERTVRVILNTLVVEYGIPIGAQSGRAGRWICANKRELDTVIADLESRATETKNRINALRVATIPSELATYTPDKRNERHSLTCLNRPKCPSGSCSMGVGDEG